MKIISILVASILLLACVIAEGADGKKPAVSIQASVVTRSGGQRVFTGPYGAVRWSPSLPVHQGDRLTVAFLPSDGFQLVRASVRLDDRSLADIKTAPWKAVVNTAGLSPGKHVVRGDLRFSGTPRTYSIAEFVFYISNATTQVKGMLQEAGPTGEVASIPEMKTSLPSFSPPSPDKINQDIRVSLHSLDQEVEKLIKSGKPIELKRPVIFRLEAKAGVDRWAYSIIRNDRQIAGAGPVACSVYLELAPKSFDGEGLLPGEVTLRAWGVRNDGRYSPPVKVPLLVE